MTDRRRRQVSAGVAAVAVLAAACGGGQFGQGTDAERVARWIDESHFVARLTGVEGDAAAVGRVERLAHPGPNVLHGVCAVLFVDTEKAADELPTPDSRLTALLQDAYQAEETAGNDCYKGGLDPTLLARSEVAQQAAASAFAQATALVRALTGRRIGT